MVHTLIIGIDTVAGRALAKQLTKRGVVTGLRFDAPEVVDRCHNSRIDESRLQQQVAEADLVVFCGDASRSSWDDGFGTFKCEELWLQKCLDAAHAEDRRLLFVSSDAVFAGPWIFHDDDSSALSEDPAARKLRKHESQVAGLPNSLVLRCNIIDSAGGTFVQNTIQLLRAEEQVVIDAATFATPVAPGDFANAVDRCIAAKVSGYINIAGAERTTPFRFAISLANSLSLSTHGIRPSQGNGRSIERSLRCRRLRDEVNVPSPLMRETLEQLTESALEPTQGAVAA